MKFISGFFKFIAFLIMSLVILLLPLSLFGKNAGEILFSRNVIANLIEENIVDEEILASLAEDAIDSYSFPDENIEGAPAVSGLVIDTLRDLEHDHWLELFEIITPSNLISDTLNSIFNEFYDWIDNDQTLPVLVIDLQPWKTNIIQNTVPVIEILFDSLPDCTKEEINAYIINLGLNLFQISEAPSIPLCKPSELIYSKIIDLSGAVIPAMVGSIPDQLDLSSKIFSSEIDFTVLKQTLVSAHFAMQWTWVIVLILYLIALPMAARSFSQLFKWAAWPLILSGGLMFILVYAMNLFSSSIISSLSAIFFTKIPTFASSIIEMSLISLINIFTIPLKNQGLIIMLIGGVSLVLFYIFKAMKTSKSNEIQSDIPTLPPDYDSMSIVSNQTEIIEDSNLDTETNEDKIVD